MRYSIRELTLILLLMTSWLRPVALDQHVLESPQIPRLSALENEIIARLPSVIGRSPYAVGSSRLYRPKTTVEEMQRQERLLVSYQQYLTGWEAIDQGICMRRFGALDDRRRTLPLLEPFAITDARYLPAYRGVLLTMRLRNGVEVLALTTPEMLARDRNKGYFLERISGSLFTRIPKGFSMDEVDAIRKRIPYEGMREEVVYAMLGLPAAEHVRKDEEELWYADCFSVILSTTSHKVVRFRYVFPTMGGPRASSQIPFGGNPG